MKRGDSTPIYLIFANRELERNVNGDEQELYYNRLKESNDER